MHINAVSSLFPSYLSPLNSSSWSTSVASSGSSLQQQSDVTGLSPTANFLNQLQQLLTENPQKYQAILTQISGQLQKAASAATASGNTTQANQLTALANSFQNAANGGTIPTAQQLQQAGLTGHHSSGQHASGSLQSTALSAFHSSNASQTQNQSLAAMIFGSI